MSRLSVLEIVLVAAWLGAALLVAIVVAPAAFRVLPTRTMAGALVGQVLPVIFLSGLIVAVLAGVIDRQASGALRATALVPLAAMILGCVVAQFVIGPRIEVVRAAIGGAVDALEVTDPRRVQFGKLHAFSVLWMGVAMLGAAAVLARKLFNPSS
jgi:hypothetical protein